MEEVINKRMFVTQNVKKGGMYIHETEDNFVYERLECKSGKIFWQIVHGKGGKIQSESQSKELEKRFQESCA